MDYLMMSRWGTDQFGVEAKTLAEAKKEAEELIKRYDPQEWILYQEVATFDTRTDEDDNLAATVAGDAKGPRP